MTKQEAMESLRLKFTSGNEVKVTRATITREEFEALDLFSKPMDPVDLTNILDAHESEWVFISNDNKTVIAHDSLLENLIAQVEAKKLTDGYFFLVPPSMRDEYDFTGGVRGKYAV